MTRFIFLAGIGLSILSTAPLARGEEYEEAGPLLTPPPSSVSRLTLQPGQSRVLRFPPIDRAAIGNPAVADIAVVSKTEILLNAKTAGQTLLFVQNKSGAASISVKVEAPPSKPIGMTADAMNQALDGTGVTGIVGGETVFLRGRVATQEEADRLLVLAKAFTPNVQSLLSVGRTSEASRQSIADVVGPLGLTARIVGDSTVLIEGTTTDERQKMLVRIMPQLATMCPGLQVVNASDGGMTTRKVVIHVRFVDIEQTALRELGFDWGAVLRDGNGRVIGVGQPFIIGQNSAPAGLLQGGPLLRLDDIGAAIKALEEGNRAKMLSSPDLVVQDNRKATLLVGGEIPVPVPQSTGGAPVVVIEYKEYGVRLEVTPRILVGDAVNLIIEPEVSTLDYANAVTLNGFRIPALRTRRVSSEVTLKNGDTLVLGGLLQDLDEDAIRKTPILSDIPIFGELFKFRSKTRKKTQLVVLVTPEVLEEMVNPPIPPLAGVKPEPIALKPMLDTGASRNDPPVDKSLPPPGPTPIPMSGDNVAPGEATTN